MSSNMHAVVINLPLFIKFKHANWISDNCCHVGVHRPWMAVKQSIGETETLQKEHKQSRARCDVYVDGLVQDWSILIANALEILQSCTKPSWPFNQLDESTARRQLKSPRSLSGRSIHLTLVTKWLWSWSWMIWCHSLCAMSISPPILRYSYFKIWPWKSMVKVMCVVKVKVTFDFKIQRSRLWSRSNPLVTFEAWSSIDMFAFRFMAIGPYLTEI